MAGAVARPDRFDDRQPPPLPDPPERGISGNALRQIGACIAKGDPLDEAQEKNLEQFRSHADQMQSYMQNLVIDRLDAAVLPCRMDVSARAKSWSTIVDKVVKGTRLERIRDTVGVRVMLLGRADRDDQDRVVRELVDAFGSCVSKTIDRRDEPVAGYRAYHLEVKLGGGLCEIQVRTPLQHRWAELSELAADRWGRDLRYGQTPPGLDEAATASWHNVQRLSEIVDSHERSGLAMNELGLRQIMNHLAAYGRLRLKHHRTESEIRSLIHDMENAIGYGR